MSAAPCAQPCNTSTSGAFAASAGGTCTNIFSAPGFDPKDVTSVIDAVSALDDVAVDVRGVSTSASEGRDAHAGAQARRARNVSERRDEFRRIAVAASAGDVPRARAASRLARGLAD